MTSWEIEFNYSRAIQQASQIDGVANRLSQAASRDMDGILNELSRAWKSDSAPQYIQKGQKAGNDILDISRQLKKIADAIRTIAKQVRDAELEAGRIANERKS